MMKTIQLAQLTLLSSVLLCSVLVAAQTETKVDQSTAAAKPASTIQDPRKPDEPQAAINTVSSSGNGAVNSAVSTSVSSVAAGVTKTRIKSNNTNE